MSSLLSSKWLQRNAQPAARSRLLCFPFGGGSASFYRDWQALLGPHIEVCAVQLPGRESRFSEPFITDIDNLLPPLVHAAFGLFDLPVHLFGYSLGAGIAQSFASYCNLLYPGAHILSLTACASSAAPEHRRSSSMMTDEEFMGYIMGLGGLPPEVVANPGLRSIALRTLRSDFTLSESISLAEVIPVRIPILAIGGDADPSVPLSGLKAWSNKTTAHFTHQVFPGDHFFVRQHLADVLDTLREFIAGSQ
jgi:medium-chain acyl-[acyl-carrier-protein] hydrolase